MWFCCALTALLAVKTSSGGWSTHLTRTGSLEQRLSHDSHSTCAMRADMAASGWNRLVPAVIPCSWMDCPRMPTPMVAPGFSSLKRRVEGPSARPGRPWRVSLFDVDERGVAQDRCALGRRRDDVDALRDQAQSCGRANVHGGCGATTSNRWGRGERSNVSGQPKVKFPQPMNLSHVSECMRGV